MTDNRTPAEKELSEDRKTQVIAWRRDGVPFEEIGRRLDPPVSKQRAHQIYAEALKQIPAMEVQTYRAEQLERLDEMLRQAREVLTRDHVAVSQGRVVRIGSPEIVDGEATILEGAGEPVLDDMPKLAALRAILSIEERRAKLLGLDTPVRQPVDLNGRYEYTVVGVDPDALT
ncbi:hypothetical protein [Amycolatopsis sp. NPDC001319]|uniref:hypothetical protein n=1 Tax=unclassified Amycolatopsis TaxID=2618356 RepID=UPI0036BE754B